MKCPPSHQVQWRVARCGCARLGLDGEVIWHGEAPIHEGSSVHDLRCRIANVMGPSAPFQLQLVHGTQPMLGWQRLDTFASQDQKMEVTVIQRLLKTPSEYQWGWVCQAIRDNLPNQLYEALFFFRPSPSWLSPGRNTVSCQLNELCRNLHRLLFGSIKKEHGPIHSPKICPCTMATPRNQTKTREQAKSTKTKQTKNQTNKNPHPRNGQVALCELAAAYVLRLTLACIEPDTETKNITIARRLGRVQRKQYRAAETRGPPSQDPGDHNATPTGHNRHPSPRIDANTRE